MRQREYEKALIDLNKAIEIHPDYVNALKNRGDIYNYYFNVDRKKAIEDYDKVISLGGLSVDSSKSICGHRAIAIYGGSSLPTYIKLIMRPQSYGCTMSENKVQ